MAGVKHSNEYIQNRRERVVLLLAKGATSRDISRTLNEKLQTVQRDIRFINEFNERGMFEMAKQTMPTLFQNCLLGINELIKECWNIYLREDENITYHHRLNTLKIAGELTEKKFNMIQNGPAIFELKKLEQRVTELRNGLELTP